MPILPDRYQNQFANLTFRWILTWIFVILVGLSSSCSAQNASGSNSHTFKRVRIDYTKIDKIFNQQLMVKTQLQSAPDTFPLLTFPQNKRFRRIRVLSMPKYVDRGYKVVEGDTIKLKSKLLSDRIRGRLICATDSGVWLYQIAKKQVVYFPYSQIQHIRSGSSGWRATYLAIIPVAAYMSGWLYYESVVSVTSYQSMILFLSWFGFTTVDFLFWLDYSDRANSSYLCSSSILGDAKNGQDFKSMAEGNRIQPPYNIFDILFSRELHFWPRTRIFKTSIPLYCLPVTAK